RLFDCERGLWVISRSRILTILAACSQVILVAIPEDNLRRDLLPHGGPDVTVCITTCNQRDYVAQCLLSVLDQGGRRLLEVIVGDDCSDDGTSEIVALIAK